MIKKHITDIKIEGIDFKDFPDFCDAFISEAKYYGEEMTEEQLEDLNEDRDYVHEELMKYLY